MHFSYLPCLRDGSVFADSLEGDPGDREMKRYSPSARGLTITVAHHTGLRGLIMTDALGSREAQKSKGWELHLLRI